MASFSAGTGVQEKTTVTNDLLNQDTRNSIYQIIKDNPGVHFREVCRSLDRKMGVVQYHARLLEEAGLIQSFGDGRYKRFFVPTMLGDLKNQPFTQKLVAFLQRDTSQKMIQMLLEDAQEQNGVNGPKTPAGTQHGLIAEKLGLTSQAITWHAKKLANDGIIQWQKVGREKYYSLTPAALQYLQ